jgi:hypothetical protein
MRGIVNFLLGFLISTTIWLAITNEHILNLVKKPKSDMKCLCDKQN